MKQFLENWLSTSPTPLRVLDIAYVVTLLPILLILKLPMLFFVLLAVTLIAIGKKPTKLSLFFLTGTGLLAIFFSLYGSFNFSGLSRLKLFVELMIYLLLFAISLQRFTGQVNFYLKISPILLLALSLFFFHSIPMLIYVLLEVFILVTMLLWYIMQIKLDKTLKMSATLYLFSLPIVILFFIFFPRISFENASYGFREETISRSGHDGLMYLDKNALLVPSKKVVMEVGFDETMPLASDLYFRGSVLYTKENNIWQPLGSQRSFQRPLRSTGNHPEVSYKVRLYPTGKPWLYLLEKPTKIPKRSYLNKALETIAKKPVTEPILYKASATLQPSYTTLLDRTTKEASLAYEIHKNPKSLTFIKAINAKEHDKKKRLKSIQELFKSKKLTYTLKPDPLDLNNSADSFLFETQKGYCVHFADAFTILSRMAGIPARVITGYKSDGSDSVESYLIIRESDAHAWVEVYLEGEWHRIEATALASFIEPNNQTNEENISGGTDTVKTRLESLNLYFLYIKYQIETWILEYSALSQKRLFSYFKSDTLFLIKFITAFIGLFTLLGFALYALNHNRCTDKLKCILDPLLNKLEKQGFPKKPYESLNQYFSRIERSEGFKLSTLNNNYHELKYQKKAQPDGLKKLKEEVSKMIKTLK